MPPKKRTRVPISLEGKVFCFVGFRDKELQDLIVAAGGTIASSIRVKAITHVVYEAGNENAKNVRVCFCFCFDQLILK